MQFALRDYAYPLEILRYRRLMREAPGWPADALARWVRARRRDMLQHAYETVPYYREVLDRAGISPTRGDQGEVWASVPLLDKETVRDNTTALLSRTRDERTCKWVETSGSTGLRLRILLDRHINAAAFALFWRAWGSGGYYRPGQRHAVMKGLYYEHGWRYNRKMRALELSSFRVAPESVEFFRDLLAHYRPRFLRGYPSAMYLFCRLLRDRGLQLHIPMVISGSETLYDFQRTEIEGVLGARLYNHYTHWERCASCLECDAGRLHAQQDYGFHEILDDAGRPVPPGVPGVITVTTLHNRAMPLIRYRTGDIGVWAAESCSCGQGFPVVERIEGRQTDYVVSASGDLVSGTHAAAALWPLPNLTYSQIIQHELGKITVRIVRAPTYRHPDDTEAVVRALHDRLGNDMQVAVQFCGLDELERSPVGKIRQCFNRLPAEVRAQIGSPLSWGAHSLTSPPPAAG